MNLPLSTTHTTGLIIVTDMVSNATNIFSLATKKSSLVATMATRILYDLNLNKRVTLKQTFHLIFHFTSKFIPTFVHDIFKVQVYGSIN